MPYWIESEALISRKDTNCEAADITERTLSNLSEVGREIYLFHVQEIRENSINKRAQTAAYKYCRVSAGTVKQLDIPNVFRIERNVYMQLHG